MKSVIYMLQKTRDQFKSEAVRVSEEINDLHDRLERKQSVLEEYIKNVDEIEVALKLLEESNGSEDQET